MKKTKKYIIVATIILVLVILFMFIKWWFAPSNFKKIYIGTQDNYFDSEKLNKEAFLWYEDYRLEMCRYMEHNDLVLKPGTYGLGQGEEFKNALKVLDFLLIIEDEDYNWEDIKEGNTWIKWIAKQRLIYYMKKNDLIIKPDIYEIKPKASYKDVMDIFEFAERENE